MKKKKINTGNSLYTLFIFKIDLYSVASVLLDCLQPHRLKPTGLLSMRFLRQEYCSELPFPPPGYLLHPGIKPAFPVSPALQVDSLPPSHQQSSQINVIVPNLVVSRSGGVAVRRYPSSKVRSSGCTLLEQP